MALASWHTGGTEATRQHSSSWAPDSCYYFVFATRSAKRAGCGVHHSPPGHIFWDTFFTARSNSSLKFKGGSSPPSLRFAKYLKCFSNTSSQYHQEDVIEKLHSLEEHALQTVDNKVPFGLWPTMSNIPPALWHKHLIYGVGISDCERDEKGHKKKSYRSIVLYVMTYNKTGWYHFKKKTMYKHPWGFLIYVENLST